MFFENEAVFLFIQFNLILFFLGYIIHEIVLFKYTNNIHNFLLKAIFEYIIGFCLYMLIQYFIISFVSFTIFTGYMIFPLMVSIGFIYLLKRVQSEKKDEIKYKKILILIGICTSIYIGVRFLIFNGELFNFLELVFFLLIFLGFSISTILLRKYVTNNDYYSEFKILLKNHKKDIIHLSIFVFATYVFVYLFVWSPNIDFSSLMGSDSYMWESLFYTLVKNNHINYARIEAYPVGYVFYTGSILIPFQPLDAWRLHYFCKIYPSIILFVEFVLMGFLLFSIYPKNKAIMWISFVFFGQLYFLSRSLMILPTILVTFTIILIFLIEYMDIPESFASISAGITFLFHPLYGVLVIFVYLLYLIFKLLIYKKGLGYSLKHLIINGFVCIIPILFFSLNLSIQYTPRWYSNYLHYFYNMNLLQPILNFFDYLTDHYLEYVPIFTSYQWWFNFLPEPLHGDLALYSSGQILNSYILLFGLIGLFLPIKIENRFKYQIILFSKIMALTMWGIFFIQPVYIVSGLDIPILNTLFHMEFYFAYRYRMMELVIFPSMFLFLNLLYEIINICEKVIQKGISLILKRNQKNNLQKKIQNVKVAFIISCICLFIVYDESVIGMSDNLQEMILLETSSDFAYDELALNLRDNQWDWLHNNSIQRGRIFYDTEDPKFLLLIHEFFNYDNDLIPFDDTNYTTYEIFKNQIMQDAQNGDIIMISSSNYLYNYLITDYSYFGTCVFNNTKGMVIRIQK